jgi:hypothetical protein
VVSQYLLVARVVRGASKIKKISAIGADVTMFCLSSKGKVRVLARFILKKREKFDQVFYFRSSS